MMLNEVVRKLVQAVAMGAVAAALSGCGIPFVPFI